MDNFGDLCIICQQNAEMIPKEWDSMQQKLMEIQGYKNESLESIIGKRAW